MQRATLRLDGKKYQIDIEQYPVTDGKHETFIYKINIDGLSFVGDSWNDTIKQVVKYIRAKEGRT
ncbi:MAG: hypothetical protein ACTSUF_03610 [Candidatus Heimdallarchaeaceae archaeon]